MTNREALAEYDNHLDRPRSVEIARDALRNQLDWLAWIPEHEFTPAEHVKLLKAFRQAYAAVRPLTAKYID